MGRPTFDLTHTLVSEGTSLNFTLARNLRLALTCIRHAGSAGAGHLARPLNCALRVQAKAAT